MDESQGMRRNRVLLNEEFLIGALLFASAGAPFSAPGPHKEAGIYSTLNFTYNCYCLLNLTVR